MNCFMKSLLSYLLILLGFSSCTGSSDEPCEYGTPTATFKIKGIVQDEDGQPIPNIQVVGKYVYYVGEKFNNIKDTLYTNEMGEFSKSYTKMQPNSIQLNFYDIDESKNGGTFKKDSIMKKDMTIIQTQKADGWYQGNFEIIANKKLKKVDK